MSGYFEDNRAVAPACFGISAVSYQYARRARKSGAVPSEPGAIKSKIYRLRQGLLGQEVDLVERPIRQARWLRRGTQFFIRHHEHPWSDGCPGQSYCTILVEDSCKCYNVIWPALATLMEELEPAEH